MTAKGKNADLPVRFASAVVMLAIAGLALWLGGVWLDAFVALVGIACLCEFARMVVNAISNRFTQIIALFAGAAYIGVAVYFMIVLPAWVVMAAIAVVVGVDVGAYFAGRTIGGPKVAPAISPSKTWSGLGGGILGASLILLLGFALGTSLTHGEVWIGGSPFGFLIPGTIIAVLAQGGDFFESWLKRKAGMKDSSNLIPGHGGVFDRVDGLLPVIYLAAYAAFVRFPAFVEGVA